MLHDHPFDGLTAIRTHIGAIFVSLELSRSRWLVTSLSPGKGEKMSKHGVTAGDVAGLTKQSGGKDLAHAATELLKQRPVDPDGSR